MKPLLFLTLISISFCSVAKTDRVNHPGSPAFLQSACQEYIELYNKKGDEMFAAFLTTSKEESFRAGYCLGAISHFESARRCHYGSTYRAAQKIAKLDMSYNHSEDRFIQDAVCQ
ncbi:hypothetical protein AB733_23865 [Photobacterium swingsii]|uniref:Rap1a immunity protein domain-containing protein n=1 Tax=Photobacterium swingsii TaxID=680026 RepID=A0A0J8V511_9GAMM|nr:hypothetical protein [Photobacterium swingsii]KMV28416.1 hypothetical protein AB733_23865 [Photobacterium swingsii]PSW18887.1 hypothetical protein C9I94_24290 [Photobacterium swingsii]